MTTPREQELITAVKAGDEDRVRAIVSIDERLADTRDGDVPVALLACYHGHPAIARALIDLGATVDVFIAAATGSADRLAVLLRGRRELLDAHGPDGWTPLGLASYFGKREAARLLLAAGADLRQRSANATGNTALHAAVAGKRQPLVELLVEAGADPNATDAGGWTPLALAAHEGEVATVRYLLAHGADPTIANAAGDTPLAIAERAGRRAAEDLLRRALA